MAESYPGYNTLYKTPPPKEEIFRFPVSFTDGVIHSDLATAGFINRAIKRWSLNLRQPIPTDVMSGVRTETPTFHRRNHGSEEEEAAYSTGAIILKEADVLAALEHAYNIDPGNRKETARVGAMVRLAVRERDEWLQSFGTVKDLTDQAAKVPGSIPVEPSITEKSE